MNPIHHPLCNTVLRKPEGMTEEQCRDLHILRGVDCFMLGDGPSVNSFWRPEPVELAAINAGAPIVLHCLGHTHPPLSLLVLDPGIPMAVESEDTDSEELVALKNRLAMAEAARDELRRWKDEQLAVESSWNPQAVADALGIVHGAPIRENILPLVEVLKDQLHKAEAARDVERERADGNRNAMESFVRMIEEALDRAGAPTHHPDIGAPAIKPMTPQNQPS